ELTRAMEAAEAANQAKSQFLANINHEMRTPLNAIIGVTELLLANSLTAQQRLQINTIGASSELLLELIEEVLDFTSMEKQEPVAHNSEFAVADVLWSAVSLLVERANHKGLEVVFHVHGSTPQRVCSDAGRLRQVLTNLVGNAIKFTDRGEIMVAASATTHADGQVELQLEVSDTGCGIPADEQSRIFQPFTQGLASKERCAGGTGLGLSICRRLVTLLGGTIGVRSAPGEGATFWLRLPVEVVEGPRRVSLPAELTEARTLVAIAGERSRAVACGYLSSWGMRAETAGGIDEAKDKIERAAQDGDGYHLCLVDKALMGFSCAATLDGLVLRGSAAKPRIIVLCHALQAAKECFHCTVGDVYKLVKPFGPRALERALRNAAQGPAPELQVAPPLKLGPAGGENPVAYHILIAEDNPASQATMLQMLTHLGYRSTAVDTGPAALEALHERRYDLLLLDCQLPGMDGYEVATEIRAAEAGDERLPIVAISADATIQQRNQCLAAGMDEFLTKPIRLGQLAKLLALRLKANEQSPVGEPAWRVDADVSVAVDEAELVRLRELDSAFADRLGHIFVQDAQERLQRLRNAVAEHLAEAVAREAHALKAGCLQVGAVTMVDICEELDNSARQSGLTDANSLLDALLVEFERVRLAIDTGRSQDSPTATH
ncbi:MAG: ATP-binding protein, partial [Gammaproteobacteria bacterium]|nr:ATP-binding protein [Gammaproteobacteria bacterium]